VKWYRQKPNTNCVKFQGHHDQGCYTRTVCVWPASSLNWRPVSQVAIVTPAQCKLVRKPHAVLSTSQVSLACAPKQIRMFPGPPGAKQSAVRCCNTGENDLTWCVTHREAVFRMVIHRIFDAWHYEVLWTCTLTRLLWYACNYVHLILYIILHFTNLKSNYQMHFIARSQVIVHSQIIEHSQVIVRSQVHSEVHSWFHWIVHSQSAWLTLPSKPPRRCQVHSEYVVKYTPEHALKEAPNCTRWLPPSLLDCTCSSTPPSTFSSTLPSMLSKTHPIALDGALLACLTVRFQVSSQDTLKYSPEHALKYTPNCTQWHTPSLLRSMLPSTLSRGKTLLNSLDYILPCMLLRARSRDLLSCRRQVPGGVRLVAYGGQCVAGGGRRVVRGMWQAAGGVCWPKSWCQSIKVVWTLSSAWPLWQDLTMPQRHEILPEI